MRTNPKFINLIFGIAIFISFMPFISPAIALVLGIILSLSGIRHKKAASYTSFTLQASIVLMGFGMSITQVLQTSKSGVFETALSVVFVMSVGLLLTKLLKIETNTGMLISAGTAICGGSAIAAVAPVIQAKNHQISFSLAVVFILNAIALVIFPTIGHYFNMSQEAFGTWAAIAIHDTSSVVGAGASYGTKALEVATTVKLIRALWIIPLAFVIAFIQKDKKTGSVKKPWFILLFVAAMLLAFLLPQYQNTFEHLNWIGKKGMVVALFLIGSNISVSEAKKAGAKSFVLGVLLWLLIGTTSFITISKML